MIRPIYNYGKRCYYGWIYGRQLHWWEIPFVKYFAQVRGFRFYKVIGGWKATFWRG